MSTFLRLLGRRLLVLPLMVVGVTLLVFFVMSLSSADPARLALGESADAAALEAYRETHGLNRPLLVRFADYLWRLLTPEIRFDPFSVKLDLGESFTGVDIYEMVARAFPITLQLTFLGLFIAIIIAGVLGVVAALYRDQWPDQLIRVFSIA